MRKIPVVIAIVVTLFSCKDDSKKDGDKNHLSGKEFEVSGTLTNATGKYVYLEEIPMATMQRVIVDSVALGKDGKYHLSTQTHEVSVYNVRLDQNTYPIGSVINDTASVTLDATFNKDHSEFAETYTVHGSSASVQMKEFMSAFNKKLQLLFYADQQLDSLQNIKGADSMRNAVQAGRMTNGNEIKALVLNTIAQSNNPALTMFVLGDYQSTANNPGFKLQPISNEEVAKIINAAADKFPGHEGLAAIRTSLNGGLEQGTNLVGQTAPDFTIPDVNGNPVKLSSYRGKYVLVDFWASWCGPCRRENPNVVAAYQQFSSKNFAILGVSFDKPGEKDKWVKAIKDDHLTWTQVSDLQHFESPVVALYQIEAIPFNVLVNPEGVIIGQALEGSALQAKLSEVLK